MNHIFKAGAAQTDISPVNSQFLFGYPFVKRYSTGVNDPLFSSALYLSNGRAEQLYIANDVIFVSKNSVRVTRRRIAEKTGVAPENILISATHTHSAPITVTYASNVDDDTVPGVDSEYLCRLEDGIVAAGVNAFQSATDAEAAFVTADATGIGTNRRDPSGPALHNVPVVAVRRRDDSALLGIMLVCNMHPTVLHEDSLLASADFPGFARRHLQTVFGECPVIHHTGPSGNQSPRHVTKSNTFAEAERIGGILGAAVERALSGASYSAGVLLASCGSSITPVPRSFPSVDDAQRRLEQAQARYEELKQTGTPQAARGAEVDLFGAHETLTLAKLEASGELETYRASCAPAEVQVMRTGPFWFAGWSGEVFVEYGIKLGAAQKNAYLISMANGEMQGYLVTDEAAEEGGYEASNALFAPETARRMLTETLRLIQESRT
ncbi:MAG: neutral/alkaline non-lysosomal ceramidase N-terminal domain-containing protein [Kiritimatiellales bacterium]